LIQRLKEFYCTQTVHDKIILSQKGLSSLLCSSQLSMADLLTKLQRDIEVSEDVQFDFQPEEFDKQSEMKRFSFNAAKFLKREIKLEFSKEKLRRKSNEGDYTTVHNEDEAKMNISNDEAEKRVPKAVFHFVTWFITDVDLQFSDDDRVDIDTKSKQKVLNFSRDILSAVIKALTPKHVGIALYILKETRDKHVIKTLLCF
jgi:RNase P/RNase MRP subunit p29